MDSKINVRIKGEFILVIQEDEARALEAITGYGADNFLSFFYEKLGSHYLKPHEMGLKSLFEGVQNNLSAQLKKVVKAREVLNG